ncbi:ABC transporter ATP-binding protein [Ornithinibacillus gellani]|uniref:ABC transporter ATP-binding protein n=1 Tax=Ornithinibacillus gellani TaxID=2293253 RepID=UPI000F4A29EA|nr:ABC transporter ATP-binding protein [Ornithinibacillus gellani]TQS75307.1 ABC transporter ATP-binding protein [Ornithinibacillus gellani]
MRKNVIEIQNLTKQYGKHRGIDNVSFSVKEGEIFGFIGPNGAGKSTAIRTLLALIHPTSGSATIFGKDCIKEAPSIAKDVGYLPSETFFYEGMTVKGLLDYTAKLYQKDCSKRIEELTERLKLDTSRKIRDLSFGNKKKVGIVAGLLHSPKLIILDEPTSGLDPLMQDTFFEILKEENEKGATILFSSHILSEIQKMCDRVAFIKEGKIISLQSIHELRSSTYKSIQLSTKEPVSKQVFTLEGISEFKQQEEEISFMYNGNVNNLINSFSTLNITDIFIEEPSLEEIFMHYYQ